MNNISLGEALTPHLPYVRRYARALTGSQHSGDQIVRATLEAIVSAPDEFPNRDQPRIGLYRMFETLWQASEQSGSLSISNDKAIEPTDMAMSARMARITPVSRRALLLTTMEGFSDDEAAILLGEDSAAIAALREEALEEIKRQTHARVLIIEDEPIIAMDIQDIVEEAGHELAAIAVTRDEAVEMFKQYQPDLVLADIQLADNSSGVDAVNIMWEERQVPVIFITAFPERLLTGEKPEPAFLITKPFQREAVGAAMAQAMFFHMEDAANC